MKNEKEDNVNDDEKKNENEDEKKSKEEEEEEEDEKKSNEEEEDEKKSKEEEEDEKKSKDADEDDVSESLLPITCACTVGSCQVLFVNQLTSPQPLSLFCSYFLFVILYCFCRHSLSV